ncbi:MAG: glycosyltransferase family 2 protein [Acidobacteriota bacterium]|nr:glycosyltransferase family 2 protein [Acidobacteriota bacterium]
MENLPSTGQLSVVILTFNEEINLPLCLDSLAGLHADVFVVDSGSTDATLEILKARGLSASSHPFDNYAAQRNWAIDNLPIETEWSLHLDADERLTPALVAEINRVLPGVPRAINGFRLRKRTFFLGRWIRHGGHYPAYHLRLFRTSKGRCEDRLYDQHFMVPGTIETLRNDYIDVVASDLTTWTIRHVKWARFEAEEQGRQDDSGRVKARAFGNPIERKRWLRDSLYGKTPLFVRPFAYWIYRYFLRLGFLDGREGLIFHFLQGCWFRFLIDCYRYEKTNHAPKV